MRPIDLQDNLSKAPLAGREQQIQQNSPDAAQRHGARELERQHVLDQSRTKETDETDRPDNRVDDHDRPNGGQSRNQRRGPSDGEAEADEALPPQAAGGKSDASRQIDLIA